MLLISLGSFHFQCAPLNLGFPPHLPDAEVNCTTCYDEKGFIWVKGFENSAIVEIVLWPSLRSLHLCHVG